MVRLPGGYCIDSTEVSRGQYMAWVATLPSTDGQDGACTWNETFAPDPTCMAQRYVCNTGADDPDGCEDFPQPCVDWCDAAAFCKAAGKRLCGKIGGGANAFAAAGASSSQWYQACSSGAAGNVYATGAALDPSCDGPDNAPSAVVTLHGCYSPIDGYGGVYDLSGNLWEWEDSCDGGAGASDQCHTRGGSFGGGLGPERAGSERCDDPAATTRATTEVNLGFRCCAD